jgi:hypothetical protein
LRTAVGVVNQTRLWMAAGDGRFQSPLRQLGLQSLPQLPADHFA